MKNNRLFKISVGEILVGIAVNLLAFAGVVEDTSVFVGMGSGILAVGLAQLLRVVRMEHNPDYKKRVETASRDERYAFISMKAREGAFGVYLMIMVRDNGKGISKRNLPYVFDKFYMEDSSRTDSRSSGLGLYIAKDIAKKHGGDITVRSREGKGSLFTLSIPEVSNSGKLAQRFEALPRPVKLILLLCFGWILSFVLRMARVAEKKNVSTLIIGIFSLPFFLFVSAADFISELVYNKMTLAMD